MRDFDKKPITEQDLSDLDFIFSGTQAWSTERKVHKVLDIFEIPRVVRKMSEKELKDWIKTNGIWYVPSTMVITECGYYIPYAKVDSLDGGFKDDEMKENE
jgi:siroheme synthase (precorrin-2 oxidase/ferrochelatase)